MHDACYRTEKSPVSFEAGLKSTPKEEGGGDDSSVGEEIVRRNMNIENNFYLAISDSHGAFPVIAGRAVAESEVD